MKILKMAMLSVIAFLPGFSTCDDDVDTDIVTLVNQSDESIYCYTDYFREDVTVEDIFLYHDFHPDRNEIKVGEKYSEDFHLSKEFKYQFVIFKKSTLNNNPFWELAEKNYYDKMYVLTSDELKAMKYTIIYTGK